MTKKGNNQILGLNQSLDKLFCACDYFLQMSVSSLLKNQCRKLNMELNRIQFNLLHSPYKSPSWHTLPLKYWLGF